MNATEPPREGSKPRCAACGSDKTLPLLQKHGYDILRCAMCGFRYVFPPPSTETLSKFYNDPSYYKGPDTYGYEDYLGAREHFEWEARMRLGRIESFARPGRLLDMGCAAGFFLGQAKARGWKIEGVEMSAAMSAKAEELLGQRIYGTLAAAGFRPESFDAITLWEYLEHTTDPAAEIEIMRRLLKPGGVLALSTPNADNTLARTSPADWKEFKPPEHLCFFSADTLAAVVKKAGLKPVLLMPFAPNALLPEILKRTLAWLSLRLGNRRNRITPFWWVYSGISLIGRAPFVIANKFRPRLDICEGLELYSKK